MTATLPVIKIPSVVHVGSEELTPELSGVGRDSLEGNLLSVSITPAAWTRIAELGGGSWTSLKREKGDLVFLDYHNLSKAFIGKLVDAAVEKGLATRVQRWQAWSTDENEDERFSLHSTLKAAIRETEEGCRKPTQLASVEAGAKLSRYWSGEKRMTDFHSIDAIVACAVEKTGLDGIWWNDNYDPWALSAPRGGIFQHRIASLKQKIVPESRYDDESFSELRDGREKIVLGDDIFAGLDEHALAGRRAAKERTGEEKRGAKLGWEWAPDRM